MKKSKITLLSILLITVLLIGVALFLKNTNKAELNYESESGEENTSEATEANETKTVTYENGDYIYIPDLEDVGNAVDEEVLFYKNIVNVFLTSKISDSQADELASKVDGLIVGRIEGAINVLQLQVKEESFDELNQLATKYDDHELVKYAALSTPLFISDLNEPEAQTECSNCLLQKQVDIKNNNWWAGVIKAPAAWKYIDKYQDQGKLKDINVAVLEIATLSKEGEAIDDDIIDSVHVENPVEGATYSKDHATLVTKIIAANKDPEKVRGVAGGVADIKFTSINGGLTEAEVEKIEEGEEVVPDLQLFSIIKSNLENGVKVFNHSWGAGMMSEKKWKEDKGYIKRLFGKNTDHFSYLSTVEKSNSKISAQLMVALDELLADETIDNDFIIVQSGGNGYSRAENEKRTYEHGLLARYTGYFANFNDYIHSIALELVGEDSLNNDLDDVLDHIIVVGGAKQTDEGYQSPDWASYGSAIDIVAPAEDILIDGKEQSGTSFSAPMVTGAAALIWSFEPTLSAAKVKQLLIDSSKIEVSGRKGDDRTYPMLDVTAFLELTDPYYDELIETYRTAINEKWGSGELIDKKLGPYPTAPGPLGADYGYELRDINHDGIKEMIVGIDIEGSGPWIAEIYTLVDDEPVKFFEGELRHSIRFYCNGMIRESAVTSPGQGISIDLFYKLDVYNLNENGLDGLDNVEEYGSIYEFDTHPLKVFQASYEENATEETFVDLMEDRKALTEAEVEYLRGKYNDNTIQVIEPTFTPFAKDKDVGE